MSQWPSSRIGSLCEFDPSKSQVRHLADNTPVSFVPMSELGVGGESVSGSETRSLADAYKGYTYFAEGDVLLAKITPCFENGKLGVVSDLENQIGFGSSEFMVLRPGQRVSAQYLAHYLSQDRFRELGTKAMTGAVGHKRVPKGWVQDFEIPLPPLAEQQRVVAILDEAFEGIEAAASRTKISIESARRILDVASNNLLTGAEDDWREVVFSDACEISSSLVDPREEEFINLPHVGARNIESRSGRLFDVLTAREEGLVSGKFLFDQRAVLYSKIRPYLMKACRPDFAGLCSADVYPLIPKAGKIQRDYLFHLLMGQKFTAYAEAGSARAGMPKVNREHLFAYRFSLPPFERQVEIAEQIDALEFEARQLVAQLESKLTLLAELKQSLLARAFAGELTSKSAAAKDNGFATPEMAANILAFMYWRHERANRSRFFGHVMAQKTLDLVERVGGVELGRRPYKDAAGPNDKPHMTAAEAWAKENQFFEFLERSGGGYDFKKLANYGVMLSAAKMALKPIDAELGRVANILVGKDKTQAEIFATVLAAWNNLIIDGKDATETAILHEARDDWHADKANLAVAKFQEAIREIRRLNLVPDGSAKAVRHKQAALF